MLEVRINELESKIRIIANDNDLCVESNPDPIFGDVFVLQHTHEMPWVVGIAKIRFNPDYSKLIIEELPKEEVAEELQKDYPSQLKQYSPLIRRVAEKLEQDKEIPEVVYLVRY